MERYNSQIKEIIERTNKTESVLKSVNECPEIIKKFGSPLGVLSYIYNNRNNLRD